MPAKEFELEGLGTLYISKRKGAKSLRLSISADGQVRLTMPYFTPYAAGLAFARTRQSWISQNLPEARRPLSHGQRIGKAHRLVFITSDSMEPASRLSGSDIRILRPADMPHSHPRVQTVAEKACIRALRLQTSKLLPGRLSRMARNYDFSYNTITVKQLTGRWGSCDQKQNITLNLFLMQLPWHLIDYVLLHELVHTRHMNHGPGFWTEFQRHEPMAKHYQKQIKQHQPVLTAVDVDTDVA